MCADLRDLFVDERGLAILDLRGHAWWIDRIAGCRRE